MTDDFVSASARHATDAEHLLRVGRLDNAGYLAGYAVECSLKAVILHSGGRPQAYGHDLAALTGPALELAVLLSPGLRRYRSDLIPTVAAIGADWRPSLRYSQTGSLTEQQASRFVEAGRMAFEELVIRLILDGRAEVPR